VGRPPITAEQEASTCKLLSQGFSERAIASQTGLSKSVVHSRVSSVLPIPVGSPLDAGYGKIAFLERRDAEREARTGRALGQPPTSVLDPEGWRGHQEKFARLDGDAERLARVQQAGAEWEAGR
jgi:hypothetical protein